MNNNTFDDDLHNAADIIKKGGVIVYPTDTVWGIGCDARNSEAVRRIYEIKHRADCKAMITLVGSLAQLERTVDGIPDVAYDLIEYSQRPTTIIYDRGLNVAPELVAADASLAVRVSADEFSRKLCLMTGGPIVSTSANISGMATPRCFSEIDRAVLDAVDYVCRWRRDDMTPHRPSVIMRLHEDGAFNIIRS